MENISRLNHFHQFDYKLKIKLFLKLTALILGVNIFYVIAFAFNNSTNTTAFFIYNPFFSPYIHSGGEHLLYNITFLAVVLIPDINYNLGINNIIKLSLLLAFMLFPFVLFEISDPIIGISGLCYLLLARVLITRKKFSKFYIGILIFFSYYEFNSIGNNDTISHLCHFLGITIGVFSIVINKQWVNNHFKITKYTNNLDNKI